MEDIEKQLVFFKQGFPPLEVLGPAVPGNGITCLSPEEQNKYIQIYKGWNGTRASFVPASGAASRMFKDLFKAKEVLKSRGREGLSGNAQVFFEELHRFAFYPLLEKEEGFDTSHALGILDILLDRNGLDFAFLPKGLIPFHKYPEGPKTPFEEHLTEAALATANPNGTVSVHFTVSEEHLERFKELWKHVRSTVEKRFGLTFHVGFSLQSPSTDTLAVTPDNVPFRIEDGTLLFRPGGHGALLKNLNRLKEDLIVIRNIDNVVPEALLEPVIHWRKVLAGYLVHCKDRVHTYINILKQQQEVVTEELLQEISRFLTDTFCITHAPFSRENRRAYASYLLSVLDRPLRVCGMVPITDEPGGGPFRIRERDGSSSLQILEEVQLNGKKYNATHFNPVDLVCSIKDVHGHVYPLQKYADEDTGFVSYKTLEGRDLKALELPGLWNGAMSRWNTVFVEVPMDTFNPVKTVTDLLRKEHNN